MREVKVTCESRKENNDEDGRFWEPASLKEPSPIQVEDPPALKVSKPLPSTPISNLSKYAVT